MLVWPSTYRNANWLYDVKVGSRAGNYLGSSVYTERQAELIEKGFLNGVTWVSLPNSAGELGFSDKLVSDLAAKGIGVRIID